MRTPSGACTGSKSVIRLSRPEGEERRMLRRPHTSDFKKAKRPVRLKRTVRTLLSPEQLNNAMARESARVDRKGAGALSLVLFRIGADQRHSLTAVRLAKTILKRIRVTDDVGWFDDEHLGVLL